MGKGASRKEIRKGDMMSNIEILNKILSKAKMSPDLHNAVMELKEAIRKKDIVRAYEISAVKSYICGSMKMRDCHFRENDEYNMKILGTYVYSILDNIHFDLAMKAGKIPAGMMIFSAEGIQQKGSPIGKSRTLELIRKEHARIVRESKMEKIKKVI
jgi:hypothetical protein